MTSDQLRAMVTAHPFVPFVIHMADVRSVEVNYPELIAYGGGRIAVVMKPDDCSEIMDLLLVTSLEAKPQGRETGPGANGTS